jgi:tRNA 2-(methylsulfanyl)-N6-isopentenyladenosine37 hydroxylase
MSKDADLPLRYLTHDSWAEGVLSKKLELLNDHAHLEKKAAANALELLNRWPEPNPPENWVTAMTAVARDEVEHLAVVTRILARRGGRLTGKGTEELVDRLMISSLIEARSCERFKLLGDAIASTGADGDKELSKLYKGLWASEHGHYLTFIQLAEQILPEKVVAKRWNEMLDLEARIIQSQPTGPRMHSSPE